MNLPEVVKNLVEAQNNFDSTAYAECFTESAIVHDEGKTHTGKMEVKEWIEHSNETYRSVMQPIAFEENNSESLLTAEVSGTFPGSPAILTFHLTIDNGLISALQITG